MQKFRQLLIKIGRYCSIILIISSAHQRTQEETRKQHCNKRPLLSFLRWIRRVYLLINRQRMFSLRLRHCEQKGLCFLFPNIFQNGFRWLPSGRAARASRFRALALLQHLFQFVEMDTGDLFKLIEFVLKSGLKYWLQSQPGASMEKIAQKLRHHLLFRYVYSLFFKLKDRSYISVLQQVLANGFAPREKARLSPRPWILSN